ncbi:MAG: hypothetical protein M0036_18515 [Desulfobacteraceae bacterium]|nr:hypothetical protein [Desulfobacteraceae bacterium]
MELKEKEKCRLGDSEHSEGAEVCCEGYCLVCKHGEWVDTAVKKDSY